MEGHAFDAIDFFMVEGLVAGIPLLLVLIFFIVIVLIVISPKRLNRLVICHYFSEDG